MRALVADDDSISRMYLEFLLTGWGYDVVAVTDGEQAWEELRKQPPPKLAIVDWMMPRVDGVELCRRLRSREGFTYVLLVTSKQSPEDVLAGLDAGAHDYLKKPVDVAELQSRIAVGERIIRYETKLQENNLELARFASEMRVLAEQRAQQLLRADRMATLGLMATGLAQEINNPATFIAGNVQTLQVFWDRVEPWLRRLLSSSPVDDQIEFIVDEIPSVLKSTMAGIGRINTIVNGLKTYAQIDGAQRTPCALNDCIRHSLALCTNTLKYHVTIETDLAPGLPTVLGAPQQLQQVFVNLFINAADAMAGADGATLTIKTRASGGNVRVEIDDTGPGILPEKIQEIWNPFYTTKEVGRGTGLGLAISQRIVESHGGRIWAENRPGRGARFVLELPCADPAAER